jgi:hypothetical protein
VAVEIRVEEGPGPPAETPEPPDAPVQDSAGTDLVELGIRTRAPEHEDLLPPVPVDVAGRGAPAGLQAPELLRELPLAEVPDPLVQPQHRGAPVPEHEEVGVEVPVDVDRQDRDRARVAPVHPVPRRHVLEGAVAAVLEQRVGRPGQGRVVEPAVVRHEEVDVPLVVEVAGQGLEAHEVPAREPGRLGRVGELPVVVPVQHVGPRRGDVEVEVRVAVRVEERARDAGARGRDAGARGRVHELPAVVPEEPPGAAPFGQEDVAVPVPIVVSEHHARTDAADDAEHVVAVRLALRPLDRRELRSTVPPVAEGGERGRGGHARTNVGGGGRRGLHAPVHADREGVLPDLVVGLRRELIAVDRELRAAGRPEGLGGLHRLLRLRGLPLPEEQAVALVVGRREVWVQLDDPLELLVGLVGALEVPQDEPAPVVARRVVRVQIEHGVDVGKGLVGVTPDPE